MKIYVASSWRNLYQPLIVSALRERGFQAYDFRAPAKNEFGFHWSAIDPKYPQWDAQSFRQHLLTSPVAAQGFKFDMDALMACDVCLLVLPCGRSAHLEAGWARGAGKKLVILLDHNSLEPELMYLMADHIVCDMRHMFGVLEGMREGYGK